MLGFDLRNGIGRDVAEESEAGFLLDIGDRGRITAQRPGIRRVIGEPETDAVELVGRTLPHGPPPGRTQQHFPAMRRIGDLIAACVGNRPVVAEISSCHDKDRILAEEPHIIAYLFLQLGPNIFIEIMILRHDVGRVESHGIGGLVAVPVGRGALMTACGAIAESPDDIGLLRLGNGGLLVIGIVSPSVGTHDRRLDIIGSEGISDPMRHALLLIEANGVIADATAPGKGRIISFVGIILVLLIGRLFAPLPVEERRRGISQLP